MLFTMGSQGGRILLEHFDMYITFNMAYMATAWLSYTTVDESRYLMKAAHAEIQQETKQGVEFNGIQEGNDAIE